MIVRNEKKRESYNNKRKIGNSLTENDCSEQKKEKKDTRVEKNKRKPKQNTRIIFRYR